MTDRRPEEKIYLTYKTRMTTESRLRFTGLIFHVILSWYSFCLIALSTLSISGLYDAAGIGIVSVTCSVGVFGLSIYTYGERYSERADQFKSCYLELQRLYESEGTTSQKMTQYADILSRYPNQSNADYDNMLVNAKVRGQELSNADGPTSATGYMVNKILLFRFLKFALITLIIFAPILLGANWLHPVSK